MQKSAENRENKNSQAYRLKNIVMKSKGMVIVGGIFLLLLFYILLQIRTYQIFYQQFFHQS